MIGSELERVKVFYYGLFMDPDLLKKQGLSPKNAVITKLPDYKLLLGERATMIKSNGNDVWGMVMDLSKEELVSLYSDPSVAEYEPVQVICHAENDVKIAAQTYILPMGYPLTPAKNSSYAKKLLTICTKLELPSNYCQRIEQLISNIGEGNYTL